MTSKGTPATTAATRAKIDFTVHEYAHDPSAPSYGREAAELLGIDPAKVHKTLVTRVESGKAASLVVAIVPVDATLDLKALATAVGAKRADMADGAVAERTTGYVLGGISPLGQKKALQTVVDAGVVDQTTVFVSAGRRGLEIELSPHDLVRITRAIVAPIAKRVNPAG